MKTLKITFLLLAVLLLTVSGQSSNAVAAADSNELSYKTQKQYDLLVHSKRKRKLETNG